MVRRALFVLVGLYALAWIIAAVYALSSDEPLAAVWLVFLGLPTSMLVLATDQTGLVAAILTFSAAPLQVAGLALILRHRTQRRKRPSPE